MIGPLLVAYLCATHSTLSAASLVPHSHRVSRSNLIERSRRRGLLEDADLGLPDGDLIEIETPGSKLRGANLLHAQDTTFVGEKRALKIAYFDRMDSTRSAEEKEYVLQRLMPATASVLSRSIRVRYL
jgi:hypothetical protein